MPAELTMNPTNSQKTYRKHTENIQQQHVATVRTTAADLSILAPYFIELYMYFVVFSPPDIMELEPALLFLNHMPPHVM